MIYVTGDTHGGIDSKKLTKKNFPEGQNLTKDDYLIILGDFGYIFHNYADNNEEKYKLMKLNNQPWTTLFLDGNHENHARLNKDYPIIDNWHGGKVHQIRENIFHLMRGQSYDLEGKKIFVMGGAESIDKIYRTAYVSWWPEEIPSFQEMDIADETLNFLDNKVDYVLTHTCPESILYQLVNPIQGMNDPTSVFLEYLKNKIQFNKWYFGHLHIDKIVDDKFRALYNNIMVLGE